MSLSTPASSSPRTTLYRPTLAVLLRRHSAVRVSQHCRSTSFCRGPDTPDAHCFTSPSSTTCCISVVHVSSMSDQHQPALEHCTCSGALLVVKEHNRPLFPSSLSVICSTTTVRVSAIDPSTCTCLPHCTSSSRLIVQSLPSALPSLVTDSPALQSPPWVGSTIYDTRVPGTKLCT